MSGAVAGLIASVKSAGSAPAPTNLVVNPSFTTNITGWDSAGNSSRDTSVFRSAPASLNTYFDGENIPYAVSNVGGLQPGSRYSLSFWIRNTEASKTFTVQFGASQGARVIPASSLWQNVKFENVLATTSSMGIVIYTTDGSYPYLGSFNIDDVSVVAGPTALVL